MNDLKLSNNIRKLSTPSTISISNLIRKLELQGKNIINLSSGILYDNFPMNIYKNKLNKYLISNKLFYTPINGYNELINEIKKKIYNEKKLKYSKKQILITNGAKQGIINILLSLLNKNDEVILFSPYWNSYYEMIKFCNGIPRIIYNNIENNFKINFKHLNKYVNINTKILIINSPNNPTGIIYSKYELLLLIKILKKFPNIVIIYDEVYEKLIYYKKHINLVSLSKYFYNRTIIVNSISKSFGLPGLRLGYIIGPLNIINKCTKVQSQTTLGVNIISQIIGKTIINHPYHKIWINKIIYKLINNRDILINELCNIKHLKFVVPKSGFYIFPDISFFLKRKINNFLIKDSIDFVNYMLYNENISMIDGNSFGNNKCIRLSFSCSIKNLFFAIKRLKYILYKLY